MSIPPTLLLGYGTPLPLPYLCYMVVSTSDKVVPTARGE